MGVNSTNMGQPQPLQLSSILSNATGLSLSSSSNQLNNVSGLSGGGSLSGGNLNNNLSQQELLQLSMSRQSTPHLGVGGGGGLDHTNIYHDASGGSPRNVHPHPTQSLSQGISQSNSSNYLDYHLGGVDLSPTRSHGDHLPSHLPNNISFSTPPLTSPPPLTPPVTPPVTPPLTPLFQRLLPGHRSSGGGLISHSNSQDSFDSYCEGNLTVNASGDIISVGRGQAQSFGGYNMNPNHNNNHNNHNNNNNNIQSHSNNNLLNLQQILHNHNSNSNNDIHLSNNNTTHVNNNNDNSTNLQQLPTGPPGLLPPSRFPTPIGTLLPSGALGGQLSPVGENELHPLLHTLRDLNNIYEGSGGGGGGGIGHTGAYTHPYILLWIYPLHRFIHKIA